MLLKVVAKMCYFADHLNELFVHPYYLEALNVVVMFHIVFMCVFLCTGSILLHLYFSVIKIGVADSKRYCY